MRRLPRRTRSRSSASCTWSRSAASAREHHPQFKARLLKPTAIAAGSGFEFEWKPEIAALDKAVEQSNLKFSHTQHLDPDRVLRRGDSQPLNCADCHRLEPDGEHFEPITMENRCADCHELTFDPGAPDRQLPHGKPREVVLTLQDYFTRKFSDPNAGRSTRERRRLPGHEEEEQTCTGAPFDCAMRSAHAEIENQFTRRGCVGCHVVVDTQSESDFDRFQVYPIRFARDYFPAGRFDHRSHQIQGKLTGDAACLSCHKAKESQDSKDLMLPAMGKCEECHGDRPAVERVAVQCVSCHSYHPQATVARRGARMHEEARRPGCMWLHRGALRVDGAASPRCSGGDPVADDAPAPIRRADCTGACGGSTTSLTVADVQQVIAQARRRGAGAQRQRDHRRRRSSRQRAGRLSHGRRRDALRDDHARVRTARR